MTREAFRDVLRRGDSPALPDAGNMYDALVAEGVRPAVFLAFFMVESQLGTQGIVKEYVTRNPGNVRTPEMPGLASGSVDTPRGTFATYPSWGAGTKDWAKRLKGPKYAGAGLTSVRQVLPKYAPSTDSNDPDKYADKVVSLVEQWASAGDVMLSKPAVVSYPSPNQGGYMHPHDPRCVVWHITQGTNSLGWLTNPKSGASSNYLIARNGTIYELVPPTVSAWANGAVQKPNLTNPVIAQALKEGRNLNTVSVSIEHEGFTSSNKGGSLTAAQVDATVRLTAWLCQHLGIKADQTHIIGHYEIDAVNRPYCPGFSAVEWNGWVNRVAALAAGGTGGSNQDIEVSYTTNAAGEVVVTINFKGHLNDASQIQGVDVQDVGVTVLSDDGTKLSRSVIDNGQAPWVEVA
jgi:N-acetyl-anhydromuramyl-L-alanine amidase AmpD